MFCKFCGKSIDDNSAFCSHCGKRQDESQQPDLKKKVFTFKVRSRLEKNLNTINKWFAENDIIVRSIRLNPSYLHHGLIFGFECGFTRMEIYYEEAKSSSYQLMAFQKCNIIQRNAANKIYDYFDNWKRKNKGFKEVWDQFLSVTVENVKFCTLLVLVQKK